MDRPTPLLRRAKQVYETEGLVALLRRSLALAVTPFFRRDTYYLWGNTTSAARDLNEADFRPSIEGLTLRAVSSNRDADELEAEGLQFRSHSAHFDASEALDSGAVAFCIFVGNELANIAWLALTQKAKDSLHEAPFLVDFSRGQAWTGGAWTNPRYRRRGLQAYNNFTRFDFLQKRGIALDVGSIRKGNVASQRANAQFAGRAYAEGRYLRILWWRSWKERPLGPPPKLDICRITQVD